MDFVKIYPTMIYETSEGNYEAFGPRAPIIPAGQLIGDNDIPYVGHYPNYVTYALARERGRIQERLKFVAEHVDRMTIEIRVLKGLVQDHIRLSDFWYDKYMTLQSEQNINSTSTLASPTPSNVAAAENVNPLPNGSMPNHIQNNV